MVQTISTAVPFYTADAQTSSEGSGTLTPNPEKKNLGPVQRSTSTFTGVSPDHPRGVRDPGQEFIVRVTYPAHSAEANRQVQDISFNSKFMPRGVRDELLRQYDSSNPAEPELNIDGFTYTLREAQANDYRIYAKTGDHTQAIQPNSSLLDGIDFSKIPPRLNPNRPMTDSTMLEDNNVKYYRELDSHFYPSTTLEDLGFLGKTNEIYLKVINELKNQKLEEAHVEIPEFDLSIELLGDEDQIKIKAETLSSKEQIKLESVSQDSLHMSRGSGEDLLSAYIYQIIKDRAIATSKNRFHALPEFYPNTAIIGARSGFQTSINAA